MNRSFDVHDGKQGFGHDLQDGDQSIGARVTSAASDSLERLRSSASE